MSAVQLALPLDRLLFHNSDSGDVKVFSAADFGHSILHVSGSEYKNVIICATFVSNDRFGDLLIYSARTGSYRFLAFNSTGTALHEFRSGTYDKGWQFIIPGVFAPTTARSQLLFVRRGHAKLYSVGDDGALRLKHSVDRWDADWTHILAVAPLNDVERVGLLFYKRHTGKFAFVRFGDDYDTETLRQDSWDAGWNLIVPDFGGPGRLLFFANTHAKLYDLKDDLSGLAEKVRSYDGWQSWDAIVPGRFRVATAVNNYGRSALFWKKGARTAQTYSIADNGKLSGGVDHRDFSPWTSVFTLATPQVAAAESQRAQELGSDAMQYVMYLPGDNNSTGGGNGSGGGAVGADLVGAVQPVKVVGVDFHLHHSEGTTTTTTTTTTINADGSITTKTTVSDSFSRRLDGGLDVVIKTPLDVLFDLFDGDDDHDDGDDDHGDRSEQRDNGGDRPSPQPPHRSRATGRRLNPI